MKQQPLRNSLVVVALATATLLLILLIAMQVSLEVSWDLADFVLAGVLLFGAGSAIVLALRRFERPALKVVAVAAITLFVALVWAELAIGLFQ